MSDMKRTKFFMESYKSLSNIFTDDLVYMNHGYYPAYPEFANDIMHKHQASLYHHLLQGLKVRNTKVLDVGCGRGGGANQYKMYGFSEIHACDISPENIQFCKMNYEDINFKICNSTCLEYPDNYFDVVTNVESSHCYENITDFLLEVRRVLKPNGFFLYCDISASIEYELQNLLLFNYIIREDITKNVELSCREDYERYKQFEDSEMKNFILNNMEEKIKLYERRSSTFIRYLCCNNIEFS